MARPILMPQVGQDLTEGKIVALKVKLGDMVKKGDIVAEVESEKATFEVEAFESGVVLELRHKAGDIATVLQPLMVVGEPGESVAGAVSAATPATSPDADTLKRGTSRSALARRTDGVSGSSPLARRLAQEAGVDIREIGGSGPGGAVVKKDVEAFRRDAPAGPRALAFNGAKASSGASSAGLRTLQSGSGDPLVLVHGFGGDLSAWRPFVLHLKMTNPILALDLPAHGGNANATADNFEALTQSVYASIAGAGLQRLHLAGHSLGAAIATSIASGSDLDVRSLSLISPAGLGPKVNGDFVAGFLSSNSEAALGMWLQLLVHDGANLPGALLRATLAAREGTRMAANQQRLASGIFSGNTQLFSIRDALQMFGGPVRVMVGREDRIIPAEYAQNLPGHVALHVLPHAGHLPQLEAAPLVARLIAETVRSASQHLPV